MALQQILCQQVQQLLHSLGLRIGFKQVGDLKLWGDVSTGMFCPLVPLPHRQHIFDHLHRPATLGCGPCPASSSPGKCGVALRWTSRRGPGSVCTAREAKCTATPAGVRDSTGAAVLTYPCGSCGTAASLRGCHLCVHCH
jgi:hypothetical protein